MSFNRFLIITGFLISNIGMVSAQNAFLEHHTDSTSSLTLSEDSDDESGSSDEIQGIEGQLTALYASRDSIAKGWHDLGYNVCLTSRNANSKVLLQKLSKPKTVGGSDGREVANCLGTGCPGSELLAADSEEESDDFTIEDGLGNQRPLNPGKIEDKGLRIIFPLAKGDNELIRKQMKASQHFNRFLRRREHNQNLKDAEVQPGTKKKPGFFASMGMQTSCLQGPAIMRACKLLSDDREIKNKELRALKTALDKKPKFKARFDKELACEIADSRELYIEKIKEVQDKIVVAEAEYRQKVLGVDPPTMEPQPDVSIDDPTLADDGATDVGSGPTAPSDDSDAGSTSAERSIASVSSSDAAQAPGGSMTCERNEKGDEKCTFSSSR